VIRHVVLLTIDPSAPTAPQVIVEALRELPAAIPELRSYEVGVDLGLADGNATVAVVADFDDVDGYTTYRDHPAHRAVIEELISPVLVARTAVQHHLDRG
jgi:hypothetical protein